MHKPARPGTPRGPRSRVSFGRGAGRPTPRSSLVLGVHGCFLAIWVLQSFLGLRPHGARLLAVVTAAWRRAKAGSRNRREWSRGDRRRPVPGWSRSRRRRSRSCPVSVHHVRAPLAGRVVGDDRHVYRRGVGAERELQSRVDVTAKSLGGPAPGAGTGPGGAGHSGQAPERAECASSGTRYWASGLPQPVTGSQLGPAL